MRKYYPQEDGGGSIENLNSTIVASKGSPSIEREPSNPMTFIDIQPHLVRHSGMVTNQLLPWPFVTILNPLHR